jgi:hypothetical protein
MGILGCESIQMTLLKGEERLKTAVDAGAAPSVFIGACGVGPAVPSFCPSMPLIRGPRSVYLRASRAGLAFGAQVRLLLGHSTLPAV